MPGILQHGLLVIDVVSREMGEKRKKKFVPRMERYENNVKNCALKVAYEVCG